MPFYDLKCTDCGHVFDVYCSMSERTNQVCPNCQSTNNESHFQSSSAAIGDSVRLGVRTIDGGFREVLSKIHSAAGRRSNLASKLSRR